MKLTNPEKLILAMLSEIYQKLGMDGVENDIDPKFIQSAIFSGNTWGLESKYRGLFGDSTEPLPSEVTEVINFLDMWMFIEEAYDKLDEPQREILKEAAAPFGANVRFNGFDGNNEPEYMGIAQFLIRDLGRFSRFTDYAMNSHMPSIGGYRRMYQVFEPIRRNLGDRPLSVQELTAILNARRWKEGV